jgi:hypothetical protein
MDQSPDDSPLLDLSTAPSQKTEAIFDATSVHLTIVLKTKCPPENTLIAERDCKSQICLQLDRWHMVFTESEHHEKHAMMIVMKPNFADHAGTGEPNLVVCGKQPSGRRCEATQVASPSEHFQAPARQLTSQAGQEA